MLALLHIPCPGRPKPSRVVCLRVWHQAEYKSTWVTYARNIPPTLIWRNGVWKNLITGTWIFCIWVNISDRKLAGFCPFIQKSPVISYEFALTVPYWHAHTSHSFGPYTGAVRVELERRPAIFIMATIIQS